MPKPLRYDHNNTLAGDVFSPITEDFASAKVKRYFVYSLDDHGAYLKDYSSSVRRFVTWPSLSACFSKYDHNTGELDPLPEPEERAVKAEYVSDHDSYLASIGAKSNRMIPDEIREQRELAEAKNPTVTVKRRIVPQPGKYGEVELVSSSDDKVSVRISPAFYLTSEQLREAAHVLNQLAEIVEGNARNG